MLYMFYTILLKNSQFIHIFIYLYVAKFRNIVHLCDPLSLWEFPGTPEYLFILQVFIIGIHIKDISMV